MNIFQKTIWKLFRLVINPYFHKYPGAMIPVMFSFQDSIREAGFRDEELILLRKQYDQSKKAK
jgi:hypothetical protein